MRTADFDYVLDESLIAEKPLKERSSSRLLVLHRDGMIEHRHFFDLSSYLDPGDMLIINNTKVFPARIIGRKDDGSPMEILLVREGSDGSWDILSKGKYTGSLRIADGFDAEVFEGTSVRFRCSGDLMDHIWKHGHMPLPPYIRRPPDQSDIQTYQTVYAANEGSIAAPTAGLHFTAPLLDELSAKGVKIRELTLHVGVGTFRPVRAEMVEDHCMDREYFEIPDSVISEVRETKAMGKRIVAVGTTTTRSLEGYFSGIYKHIPINTSASNADVRSHGPSEGTSAGLQAVTGTTDLFIYPGYVFKAVSSLITNFHLPRSTPLMLVCALAKKENILRAYREAIANKYRFLSYGDAMLIL